MKKIFQILFLLKSNINTKIYDMDNMFLSNNFDKNEHVSTDKHTILVLLHKLFRRIVKYNNDMNLKKLIIIKTILERKVIIINIYNIVTNSVFEYVTAGFSLLSVMFCKQVKLAVT